MTRKRLVCLRTPVSHQRQLRRRSADEVGFVQSLLDLRRGSSPAPPSEPLPEQKAGREQGPTLRRYRNE